MTIKTLVIGLALGLAVMCLAPQLCVAAQVASVEVWSPNPAVAIFEGPNYAGRNDTNCAILVNGARNGIFTGQVVLFSGTPAIGEPAVVSDLALKGSGGGMIRAADIRVLYGEASNTERNARRRFPSDTRLPQLEAGRVRRHDTLWPEPPGTPALTRTVWLKIRVPAAAKPGLYEGALSVAARSIPVRLNVADWRVPDPSDFVTHVGLIQSPDSVALHYGLEPWSDVHFEHIGRSFDLMAEVGNKVMFVPVLCRTHLGNEQGMVRWIKDGDGYRHDFSPFEKYLDLYIRKIGKPKVVCFYVWEVFCGAGYFDQPGATKGGRTPVSLLDAQTGQIGILDGPAAGTPEAEAFWSPVFEGLRSRMSDRGLGDEVFMIGVAGDARPTRAAVDTFKKVAPQARWVLHSHGRAEALHGVKVGYLAHVWGAGGPPDPDAPPRHAYLKNYYYGWNQDLQVTVFPRYGGENWVINPPLWMDAPLAVHRTLAEACLGGNLRGFGRVGADFWPVIGERQKRTVLGRFPESHLAQLSVDASSASIFAPGPGGALSTVRFENLREGIQTAEAKIFIERALLDKDMRAKLGEDAAQRFTELLKERIRRFREAQADRTRAKGWEWYSAESGWQERDTNLFDAASEVAMLLGDGD